MPGEPAAAEAGVRLHQPEARRVFSLGSCPWITGPWQWRAAQAPGRGGPLHFFILFLQTFSHYLLGWFICVLIQTQSLKIFLVCNMGSGYKSYHPLNLDEKIFTILHFSKTNYICL